MNHQTFRRRDQGGSLEINALMGSASDAEATPTSFHGVSVIAFDLDNTLVDIIRVKERAAEAAAWALADAGLDVNPRKAAYAIMRTALEVGIDRDDVVAKYLERALPAADPKLEHVGQHAFERAEDENAIAYPRAHRTLLTLARRGFTLAVVTDAPRHRAIRRLQATRLLPFFTHVITLEDSPNGKADTTPYARLAQRVNARPHEILMIGDNPARDVGAAQAYGCRAVLATYGLQACFAGDVDAHAPDARIRWLDGLLPLLPAASTPLAAAAVSIESDKAPSQA
jgi:phosphoglycolate phosphatase